MATGQIKETWSQPIELPDASDPLWKVDLPQELQEKAKRKRGAEGTGSRSGSTDASGPCQSETLDPADCTFTGAGGRSKNLLMLNAHTGEIEDSLETGNGSIIYADGMLYTYAHKNGKVCLIKILSLIKRFPR